jgi:hypothetical protein
MLNGLATYYNMKNEKNKGSKSILDDLKSVSSE